MFPNDLKENLWNCNYGIINAFPPLSVHQYTTLQGCKSINFLSSCLSSEDMCLSLAC
jgi:hypothetical protein